MNVLKAISIRAKIAWVVFSTSLIGVLLAVIGMVLYEWSALEQRSIDNLNALADMMSITLPGALSFNDPIRVYDTLSILEKKPEFLSWRVYDETGALFAANPRLDGKGPNPPAPSREGLFKSRNRIEIAKSLEFKKEKIGWIFLEFSVPNVSERLWAYTKILSPIFAAVLLIGAILSNMLRRQLAIPLLKLTEQTEKFARTHDHSIRMPDFGRDEIGILSLAFNQMLETIQNRETQLHQSHAMLRQAGLLAKVGGWELDAASNRMLWSEEIYNICELPPNTPLTEETIKQQMDKESGRALRAAIEKTLQTAIPFDMETMITTATQQKRWVRIIGAPDGSAKKSSRIWGSFQDITERKNAQETQAMLEKQLRQSQKMDAIGQLAGGVAHDFNNLLTVIIGNSYMLQDQSIFKADSQTLLQEVTEAADRAASLTRQLLAFSRKQTMQVCILDMNTILGSITKMLSRIMGEHISLECRLGADLPKMEGDPGMLEQVIMNLLVNARDAMQHGGRVVLETTKAVIDENSANLNRDARPGQYVCLTVTDSGCGMDAEVLTHIFEPFFTTKEQGKGTGLGLATVYGIVKQHHGWIDVASRVGEGTTFKIFFPASSSSLQTGNQSSGNHPIIHGHETIFIVEDEAAVRRLISSCLHQCGYHIIEASNGVEALGLWRLHSSKIDLLITDMVMPGGISGRELAMHLRASKPTLRVLFSSGYNPDTLSKEQSLETVDFFLPKPYNPATLTKSVRQCLDQKLVALGESPL